MMAQYGTTGIELLYISFRCPPTCINFSGFFGVVSGVLRVCDQAAAPRGSSVWGSHNPSLGAQVPSKKVFGVGLEGPNMSCV